LVLQSFFGIDNVAPGQVPALEALDKDFGRGNVGGEGDVVLVAEAAYEVYVRIVLSQVPEEKY
jgi:hypothetical protein